VVGGGTSVLVPAIGQPAMRAGTQVGLHPKVRRGWALKRLDVPEGRHRWVLRDLRGGRFLRFDDEDATLFQLIDGEHSLVDLIGAVHEFAHALTMASYGRKVERAGIKLIFIIPFAFVDTSEAWFEPRRRRMAVSAAGPVSDMAIGGLFALLSLGLPAGNVRDI